jgi:hypothetical protein
MPNEYAVGEQVRCTGTFTNAAGTNVDPTIVFFQIRDPTNTVSTVTEYQYGVDPEVVRSAVGVYYIDVDGDKPGHWYYRPYSTGSGAAAKEGEFRVKSSRF